MCHHLESVILRTTCTHREPLALFNYAAVISVSLIVPDIREWGLTDIARYEVNGMERTYLTIGEDIGHHPGAYTAITVAGRSELELPIVAQHFLVREVRIE